MSDKPQVNTSYVGTASFKMNLSVLLCGMGFLLSIFHYWNDIYPLNPNDTVAMIVISCLQIGFSGIRILTRLNKDCRSYHNPQPISYVRVAVVLMTLFVSMVITGMGGLTLLLMAGQNTVDYMVFQTTALILIMFGFSFINSLQSLGMMFRLSQQNLRAKPE